MIIYYANFASKIFVKWSIYKKVILYLKDTIVTFFTNPYDLKTGQVIIVIVILTLVVSFIMSIINSYWGD